MRFLGESLRIWNFNSGKIRLKERIPGKHLVVSPTGEVVIVDSQLVKLDNLDFVELDGFDPHLNSSDSFGDPVFSPDGSKLFAVLLEEAAETGDTLGACWNTNTRKVIWTIESWGAGAEFTSDSEWLLIHGVLVNATDGSPLRGSAWKESAHILGGRVNYITAEKTGGQIFESPQRDPSGCQPQRERMATVDLHGSASIG